MGDKIVELNENRRFFARILIGGNSRLAIGLKIFVGTYELSTVPRSLFAGNGSIYHCSDKSQLMTILEKTKQNKLTNL